MSDEGSSEICCPRCNHAFGPLAGVPAGPREPFTADVTCPSCNKVVTADTIVLVGGDSVDALGRVRVCMVAALALGALWAGMQCFADFAEGWSGTLHQWSYLVMSLSFSVSAVGWWLQRSAGEKARMARSRELRWLISPGSIEFIDERLHGYPQFRRPTQDVPSRRLGAELFALKELRQLARDVPSRRLGAELLRGARAQVSGRTAEGLDGIRRSVVEIVLEYWKPLLMGRWRGIASTRIFVTAGLAGDSVERGTTAAIQADGDRLAERIFRHCTGQPVGVHGHVVTLRGHPDPVKTWPRPLRTTFWPLMVTACALWLVMVRLAMALSESAQRDKVGLLAVVGGVPLLLATACLQELVLARGAWRRELTRCVWTVDRQGLHVEQESRARPRSTPEHRSWLVPADSVADVEVGTAVGRPRIMLRGRDGSELAAITPDTLPADGLEASRRCLLAALGRGADSGSALA